MTWHRSTPHKSPQIIPARHTGMGPHPTYMKYYCQPIKMIRPVSSSTPLQLNMTPLCFMSFWINLKPTQDSPKKVGIALCQRKIISYNRYCLHLLCCRLVHVRAFACTVTPKYTPDPQLKMKYHNYIQYIYKHFKVHS